MTKKNISIDASTICQLRCPECSTSKGLIKNGLIGSGFLSFQYFKHLIDNNPTIQEVELSNWGEIFLNPEILKIIKYGYESKIKLTAGNGVNFVSVDNEVLEALVEYKFGYLNISIDGASQETYCQYRIGGDFNRVINNITTVNSFKAKYKSEYPKLAWQFIIFGHNEHEILLVKDLCKEFNMVFNPRLNHSNFSPTRNKAFVRKESGLNVASRDEYKTMQKKSYKRPCCQLWYSPQINWDGKLLGCCVNKWISFGDVFKDGLDFCLESPLFQDTKLMLQGKIELNEMMPCYFCPTFQQINEQPITEDELKVYCSFIHPAESQ
jgi:MoaA/NifB/PqqE/SkfB family radical SAM enzyme